MAFLQTILLAVAVIVSAVLGYWVQDRSSPVREYVAEVVPPNPTPGTVLRIRHKLLRERICHVKLQQIVFDKNRLRYTAPIQEYIIAPGIVGPDEFMTSMLLPAEMEPGPGFYRPIRAYYCNPIHWLLDWPISVVLPDVHFTIGPRLAGPQLDNRPDNAGDLGHVDGVAPP